MNGCETETVSLPLQGVLVRKVAPTSVVVGHAGGGKGAGVFHLSGVQVYRAPALSASLALHLAAHGPDHACQVTPSSPLGPQFVENVQRKPRCSSQVRCDAPNFPLVLTPSVLDSSIDWDQVSGRSRTECD